MLKPNNQNKGFTILELIVTIFIVVIGILGAYILTSQIVSYIMLSNTKLTAYYLAQEGIELVKNLRDTTCLEVRRGTATKWDDFLNFCSGECEIDYNDTSLVPYTYPGRFLKKDNGGFYNYETGADTKFKRKITLTSYEVSKEDYFLKVLVNVTWQEKGKDYSINVQENLYNLYCPEVGE